MTKKPTKEDIIKNLQEKLSEVSAENLHYQKENERLSQDNKDIGCLLENKIKDISNLHGEMACLKESKAYLQGMLDTYQRFLGINHEADSNDSLREQVVGKQLQKINVNELPEPIRNVLGRLFNEGE